MVPKFVDPFGNADEYLAQYLEKSVVSALESKLGIGDVPMFLYLVEDTAQEDTFVYLSRRGK